MLKLIRQLIAHIDLAVKRQLVAILEHESFQDLLSNWSCLHYLLSATQHNNVKIKLLDLKWHEIPRLVSEEVGFGSFIAQKIFHELDLPGNDPISIIVAAYTFDASNKHQVGMLAHFAETAYYAFAPFITSIDLNVFGIETAAQFSRISLEELYQKKELKHLLALSETPYANFLGLTLPKTLFPSLLGRKKRCNILKEDIKNYSCVFGHSAYLFAAFAMNSFMNSGWFLEITEYHTSTLFNQDSQSEPINRIKPYHFFSERYGALHEIFHKYTTEFLISENKEKELSELGFIAICHVQNRDFATIYSANSLRNLHAKTHSDRELKISASLQYMLCVSRFAHYIKVIGRQKVGLFSNPAEFEYYINNWLLNYIASDPATPLILKQRYPLMEAKVQVREDKYLKDAYACTIYLKPHLISSQLSANITLKTKFTNITT